MAMITRVARTCWAPLLGLVACAVGSLGAVDWRFMDQYPAQYLGVKLGPSESAPVMDGRLDDPVWLATDFTDPMVDITRHQDQQLNAVPSDVNARVKVRWDDDYFYVGAVINEPYVTGTLFGHNKVPPYHDNDFEVFVDVSGTTQYYVEFEMSVLNSTYDIKWGRPDMTPCLDRKGRCCAGSDGAGWPALPTCVNTSFPGYAGNWSMATRYHPGRTQGQPPSLSNGSAVNGRTGTTAAPIGANDSGMIAATSWDPDAWNTFVFPHSQWSLEVRYPLRQTPGYWKHAQGPAAHGGLLDADPTRQAEWNQYDPALGDAGPGRPRYWWVNFAHAEHTRNYTLPDGSWKVCPKNCTADLEHAVNTTPVQGGMVKNTWPTILGSYWEWVEGPVGDAHPGVGYMHRPSSFPLIQFAANHSVPRCNNIEFPGRHVAKSMYMAQVQYYGSHSKTFATDVATLLNTSYCNLDLGTSDTCDFDALQFAISHPSVFQLSLEVTNSIAEITRDCPTRPCFVASVQVTVPDPVDGVLASGYRYTATVNSNRDVQVSHADPKMTAPCL